MTKRHLLSPADLDPLDLTRLVDRSAEFSESGGRVGCASLSGAMVGIYFRATSTRTPTAFTTAAQRLGAGVIAYGPNDFQENTGESVSDTGRVPALMLDGLVARTAGDPAELREMARQRSMSVVNAVTRDEHPTQAVADLSLIKVVRGGLDGVRLVYFGEGNNTAVALTHALARVPGAVLTLVTPPGYGVPDEVVRRARENGAALSFAVTQVHDAAALPPGGADIVYTTRWQTTGTSKPDAGRREAFAPFRVTERVMDWFPDAVFMHDLPAHRGEEVDAEVIDGPRSVAFEQARHKLFSAMSVLEWAVAGAVGT